MIRKKSQMVIDLALFLILATVGWYDVSRAGETLSVTRVDSITVDGQVQDWPSGSSLFFKDEMVAVGLCRNDDYLFVTLRFTSEEYAREIRMGGLKIYVDPKGKENKDFKISYFGGPEGLGPESDEPEGQRPGRGQSDGGQQPQRPPGMENRLTVYRKDVTDEKVVSLDGSQGPAAACGVDKGFYVYELRIPYQEGVEHAYGLPADFSRPLGIGVVWGDMEGMLSDQHGDRPERGSDGIGGGFGGGPPGGMGGGPGGMGGGPPGGMGGRPGGLGGSGGKPSTVEKKEMWLKAEFD